MYAYTQTYSTTYELQTEMDEYIQFYNNERPHRHINMKTPVQYESEFYETLDI
ncbi:MAG: transposase [Clostridiales bacterium]|nr:transposase [Clostridiales bacterium]